MTWLPAFVTVAPASEPLTTDEVKAQARVDGADSDDLLDSYIIAARAFVEDYCGIKLVEQTVELRCSRWCDLTDLPVAPLMEVTGIEYLDTDGVSQTLSTDVYEAVLFGATPHIRLKVGQSWPATRCASDAITVTATAGYDAVPTPIKQAMLLMIANWFDSRTVGEMPDGARSLLSNYRRF